MKSEHSIFYRGAKITFSPQRIAGLSGDERRRFGLPAFPQREMDRIQPHYGSTFQRVCDEAEVHGRPMPPANPLWRPHDPKYLRIEAIRRGEVA